MAKLRLRRNSVNHVVTKWHVTLGGMHAVEDYRVRFLGRGLWRVTEGDGYWCNMGTSQLQRFFNGWVSDDPTRYEEVFYTVGARVY